ncbi:MAG: response regulator transcription factor [Clostridia bacterium]|nr:response regulator transcription factor [Clostridia bacterium]
MKILITDDQKLLRDCLKHAIENNSDFEVVACAENGEEAVQFCRQHAPDLVLMDIMMPVCDGIEATKQIKALDKNIKVLMLTTSQSNEDVETAIRNGADGYVLKSIGSEELILAVKSVYSGLDIIHKDVYKAATRNIKSDGQKDTSQSIKVNDVSVVLSPRDIKIIQCIIDGKDTAEIAKELFLTEGRVRNIITEMISKLSLKDRAQLVAFAFKNNLV